MTTQAETARLPQEPVEERQRQTRAALEEVDSGRVVDHAEVEAWAARTWSSEEIQGEPKPPG